jgi:hypothetical protein
VHDARLCQSTRGDLSVPRSADAEAWPPTKPLRIARASSHPAPTASASEAPAPVDGEDTDRSSAGHGRPAEVDLGHQLGLRMDVCSVATAARLAHAGSSS